MAPITGLTGLARNSSLNCLELLLRLRSVVSSLLNGKDQLRQGFCLDRSKGKMIEQISTDAARGSMRFCFRGKSLTPLKKPGVNWAFLNRTPPLCQCNIFHPFCRPLQVIAGGGVDCARLENARRFNVCRMQTGSAVASETAIVLIKSALIALSVVP